MADFMFNWDQMLHCGESTRTRYLNDVRFAYNPDNPYVLLLVDTNEQPAGWAYGMLTIELDEASRYWYVAYYRAQDGDRYKFPANFFLPTDACQYMRCLLQAVSYDSLNLNG